MLCNLTESILSLFLCLGSAPPPFIINSSALFHDLLRFCFNSLPQLFSSHLQLTEGSVVSSSTPFQVFIVDLQGHHHCLNISPYATVVDLQHVVCSLLHIPVSSLSLSYHCKPLRSELSLADYNIVSDSNFYVSARLCGGSDSDDEGEDEESPTKKQKVEHEEKQENDLKEDEDEEVEDCNLSEEILATILKSMNLILLL